MQPQPYDIYNAEHRWKDCDDARPWLVVDERKVSDGSVFGCFPIASECYFGNCFFVDSRCPEFNATGLKKNCYIHDESVVELSPTAFKAYRGKLTGRLLDTFKKHAGL